jgi:uncharacterized membrane protein
MVLFLSLSIYFMNNVSLRMVEISWILGFLIPKPFIICAFQSDVGPLVALFYYET